MSDQLNVTIALAKQAFDELLGLTTLDEIEQFRFESGPRRDRIEASLKNLNRHINTIDAALSELVSDAADPPLLSLPSTHRNHYHEVVVKHGQALQRAHLKAVGLDDFLDILDTPEDANPRPYRLDAFTFALERWRDSRIDNLDENELEWMSEWYPPAPEWLSSL